MFKWPWQSRQEKVQKRYAAAQRLDMARFRAALDQHTHRDEIAVDQDAARAFGFAFESPTVFVNGRRVGSSASAAELERVFNAALAASAPTPAPAPAPRR